jgi:MerR family transcriptional regulator, light-induced transcriptional regulator
MKKLDPNALFPIREVSRLTGIKPITLRAWERRYELIEPVRTESGHRLYTQEHIDYLNQALKLMDDGIPISRVKTVLSESPSQHITLQAEEGQPELISQAISAANNLDLLQLERCIDRLFANYSLLPLLPILMEIESKLNSQYDAVTLSFWQSSINQRLQVRLHHFQQAVKFSQRTIYIQQTEASSAWLTKFIALFCFEQGYQPLQFDKPMALEELPRLHQQLDLHGFILIVREKESFEGWSAYIEHFSSIKSWVFAMDTLNEMSPPSINCELRTWPYWLTPL